MSYQWYALRSKSRKEDAVWRQLQTQGVEVFYPCLRVHPVNPRSRKLVPYFPGYLFVEVDLEQSGISVFQWMPHTVGLVSFGGEPSIVPENLILAIQKRVDEINAAGGEIFDGLKPGEAVWISDGPFQGYEAIFDGRLPGSERVRVLLEFLGNRRRVPVVLDASQIVRQKRKGSK
jgi:transcription antitermination factor NusG